MRAWCLAALVAFCTTAPVWATTPEPRPAHLVADLTPGFAPSEPASTPAYASFTAVNGRVIYQAFCSLWSTDGTAAGISRLAPLCTEGGGGVIATTGSSPQRVAFFTPASGRLWSTDGTAEKTFPLGEVTVGHGFAGVDRPLLGPGGRELFFEGCTEAHGCEPWRSDGTPEGTVMLGDLRRGPEGSNPSNFSFDGHRVLFSIHGAVWATDGSPRGTIQLFPAEGDVLWLKPHGPEIFFQTYSGVWVFDKRYRKTRKLLNHGSAKYTGVSFAEAAGRLLLIPFDVEVPVLALWTTDGTGAGTHRLGPRFTGGLGELAGVGSRVVFSATNREGFFPDLELWFLDPEMRAPERFAGCPGGCPTLDPLQDYVDRAPLLAPFKGHLLFAGRDSRHGTELWSTDGTPQGTRLLKDLCPGACDGTPLGFKVFEDRLLFLDAKRNLWATDGTEAGTIRLASQPPVVNPSLPFPVDAAVIDGRIVFNGFDPRHGAQVWVSDLTPEGTAPLTQTGFSLAAGSDVRAPTALGARIVFGIDDGTASSLWASDGTAAGTVRLPPADAPCCSGGIPLGGPLFFFQSGARLFRTDGTAEGTQPILDLGAGKVLISTGFLGDRRLLAIAEPSPGTGPAELWTSDGTAQGTRKLLTLPSGGFPEVFMALGSQTLFFFGGLWRTDGTVAGTLPIQDELEFASFRPGPFFHGKVFFLARNRQGSIDLWGSDGTAGGTGFLGQETAFPRPSSPSDAVVFRDALYFIDWSDQMLWHSDGTAAGTRPFELPLNANGDPLRLSRPPVPLGNQLFFVADDGVHGWGLWKTDGTATGTVPVSDVALAHSSLDSLTAAGGRLYFAAGDGEHGLELWTSDGTATGTRMVQDILPGPGSSWPQNFAAADGNLFFTANDGEHGRELWVLPLEPWP